MALMALKLQAMKTIQSSCTYKGLVEGLVFLLFGDSKTGSCNYVYPKTPKRTESPEME